MQSKFLCLTLPWILTAAHISTANAVEKDLWTARVGHATPMIPRLGVQTASSFKNLITADLVYHVTDNFGPAGGVSQAREWGGASRSFELAGKASSFALQATRGAQGNSQTITTQLKHGALTLSLLKHSAYSQQIVGLASTKTDSDIDDAALSLRLPIAKTGLYFSTGIEALKGSTLIKSSMPGMPFPDSTVRSRIRTLNLGFDGWLPGAALQLPGVISLYANMLLAHQDYPLVADDPKAGRSSKFEANATWIAPWNPTQFLTTVSAHMQKQTDGQLDVLLRMPLTGFNGVGAHDFGELIATDGVLVRLDQAIELPHSQRLSVFTNYARGRDKSSTAWINVSDIGIGYSRLPTDGLFVRARTSWPINERKHDLPGSSMFSDGRSGMRAWIQAGFLF